MGNHHWCNMLVKPLELQLKVYTLTKGSLWGCIEVKLLTLDLTIQ